MRIDLTWAYNFFNEKQPLYDQFHNYYTGLHEMFYGKINRCPLLNNLIKSTRENICKPCIEIVCNRLNLAGFNSENKEATDYIKKFFRQNRINSLSKTIHKDCMIYGDAYISLWDDGKGIKLYTKNPTHTTVHYNEEGIIDCGVSYQFFTDLENNEFTKVFVYYPDKIYSKIIKGSYFPISIDVDENDYIKNPFNVVPIFHFYNSNRQDEFAVSDLIEIIPLQRNLNKTIQDRAFASEMGASKQKWIAGISLDDAENSMVAQISAGPNKVLTSTDPETRFGEFSESDLSNYTGVIDSIYKSVACISRIPLHIFNLSNGNFPSGEALKTAESPLNAKIQDRQVLLGDVYEDIFKLILERSGFGVIEDLEAIWEDTTPYSENEKIMTASNKIALGIPENVVFKELGYEFDTEDKNNEDY